MVAPARTLVTEAEFLRLPESNQCIELVDGAVIVSPSPTLWHQEVLSRLVVELRAWARRQEAPHLVGPGRAAVAQVPAERAEGQVVDRRGVRARVVRRQVVAVREQGEEALGLD